MLKEDIEKIWLTDEAIHIRTKDGREAIERFGDYLSFRYATPEQRKNYTVGIDGLHWKELDEDLCFEGFFYEKSEIGNLIRSHPELNASVVARRLGIHQSLFAAYVTGSKKPSEKRKQEIIDEIHKIGRELTEL